jgi:uncharacterized membrane protein
MKTRIDIKETAKKIIRENYSMSIVPFIIYLVISAVASTLTLGIGVIITLPLFVGMQLIYIMLWRYENPTVEIMFTSAFQENFARKLGGMLWMHLFTYLWSLLFVIPGIVKSYSYSMTPYILAKYPGVSATDALKISMRIMKGHKLDLFIVDLSFIGWNLLGMLTAGILNVFYVYPYMLITKAGCFDEYLSDSLSRGVIDSSELIS